MKLKYVWVALITLSFFGCDDNNGSLGLGMFPDSDQNIRGNLATFDVTTQSELSGDVFAKTSIGYIGKFTDPFFGFYEAGFLAQLHATEATKFPPVWDGKSRSGTFMVEDKIYATELVFSYSSYFGDSLNACRMSVYQLDKDLEKDKAYYTNIIPSNYYDTSAAPIGRKAYSAVDLSLSDSIRNLEGYTPFVRISLPNSIGENIYAACKAAGDKGIGNAEFQKLFKGIYAKSDYGDGTVLYLDQIQMNVAFKVYVTDLKTDTILWSFQKKMGVAGATDSIDYRQRTFAATKEIIQANSFNNDKEKLKERAAEKEWTYLKTPAGIYTQATLPLATKTVGGKVIKGLPDSLKNDTINAVKLTFNSYNQTNDYNKYKFSIKAPRYVLLVRDKEKESFFEENKITDNITSYIAEHSTSTNQYVFNNLTKLITTCMAEKEAAEKELKTKPIEVKTKDKDGKPITVTVRTIEEWMEATRWDKVALIPVLVNVDASGNLISVQNDLKPGYAKLKGGALGLEAGEANEKYRLKMEVISTSFNKQ